MEKLHQETLKLGAREVQIGHTTTRPSLKIITHQPTIEEEIESPGSIKAHMQWPVNSGARMDSQGRFVMP